MSVNSFLYEYAVIRILPKVEREEFMNAGIILFSKQAAFIKARYTIDEQKLKLFAAEMDLEILRDNLSVFNKVCSGKEEGGAIAQLPVAERFRWLTAIRSTTIQTSRPHPGYTSDLEQTFESLFDQLVR